MDKELKELHDLYNKHEPIWMATLIAVSPSGIQLAAAIGLCACGNGVYTGYTKAVPVVGDWTWEEAPIRPNISVGEMWRPSFDAVIRGNAELGAARQRSISEDTGPKGSKKL